VFDFNAILSDLFLRIREQIELRKNLENEALEALSSAAAVVDSVKEQLKTKPTDRISLTSFLSSLSHLPPPSLPFLSFPFGIVYNVFFY
jgi:hypothetical protein